MNQNWLGYLIYKKSIKMHVTGYKNTTKIVVYLTFNFSIVYSTSSCMRSSFSLRAYDFCKILKRKLVMKIK